MASQKVEKEVRTRDWLQEETLQKPQKRLKQMNLEMPVKVKKAGKKVFDEKDKKVSFKFNKKGKLTKEEKKEIKRTSKNIFDWFRTGNDKEHPLLDRAGDGDHEHGGEGGVGGMLLFAEGHPYTQGGSRTRTPQLL